MRKKPLILTLLLVLAAAAALVLAVRAVNRAHERDQLTQRLMKEEIYMFQDSYSYHAFARFVDAYYMVCEPVDDKIQLVEKLERLMEEKQVVQGVRDYYRETLGDQCGYDDLYIFVNFYRPSREFPIGWQPLEAYDMWDYSEINEYEILSICIPWDAETLDDHTYYFPKPDKPVSDVYTRQTQEDGSFVLIPKQ